MRVRLRRQGRSLICSRVKVQSKKRKCGGVHGSFSEVLLFLFQCLREKALNQTGRVTLTMNRRERERDVRIKLIYI